MKTNREKKQEFDLLLTELLSGMDLPKPILMLGKSALRSLDEEKMDSILDGTLNFLANAYAKIEAIQLGESTIEAEAPPLKLIKSG